MIKLTDIKCIIWDLDDTFWTGTLSEGDVALIKENVDFLIETTEIGIIHSICSKNDFEAAKKKLEDFDLWKYFVFPSVNWESKGQRILNQIKDMNLRAENVLFLDDNHINLSEAEFYNKNLKVAYPDEVGRLRLQIDEYKSKKKIRRRLEEYKILEEKSVHQSQFSSNEDFLHSSNICVGIRKNCLDEIDRVHELILRTNQLNFTKKRIEKNELEEVLKNPDYDSGCVWVKDRFGEYGLVGFYCVGNGKVEHFVFSCRILGMGVEQYVYAQLNFPEFEVVGEVVANLDRSVPKWINVTDEVLDESSKNIGDDIKIMFKGPCDIQSMFSFIKGKEEFCTEMTFINDKGTLVENQNHTVNILNSVMLSDEEKQYFSELPFYDDAMFSTRMFGEKFDVIVFSTLTDQGLGVYRCKENGKQIAFGEAAWPLTDKANHQAYEDGKLFTAYCKFSKEFLEDFARDYEFVGALTVEQCMENLREIEGRISDGTKLVLILGSEMEFEKEENPAYYQRHKRHAEVNAAIREWAATKTNIYLIDVNDYLCTQGDFYNNINHYMKHIYFKMAKRIIEIINAEYDKQYKGNRLAYIFEKYKLIIKKLLHK